MPTTCWRCGERSSMFPAPNLQALGLCRECYTFQVERLGTWTPPTPEEAP